MVTLAYDRLTQFDPDGRLEPAVGVEMVTLAYDRLTQFDPDGRLEPALADRWTASRDGRRYVFHLRAGVKFHNGTPLTAAAVRASFLRVLAPGTKGGRPWPLYPIAGAEAYAAGRAGDVSGMTLVGDSALAFTLTEPLAISPKFLAMPVASVVPPPLEEPGQRPIGSGPWRFVAWQHDDALTFARNPDYWGGAPLADTLTVRIVPEPLTRPASNSAARERDRSAVRRDGALAGATPRLAGREAGAAGGVRGAQQPARASQPGCCARQ